jgi:Tfp pilus assembly PilM family ATPase
MASHKDSICGIEIQKGLITIAQYSPQENAVGSIVINPFNSMQAHDDAELRGELKKLITDLEFKRQRIVLALPAEFAIVKKVLLDSDEDNVAEAIVWDLSQHIIGSIDEYSVDFEPIRRSSQDAIRRYLAVAYRTAAIEKLTALLKANKLNPCIVDLDIFAIINVFEANYQDILTLPAILALCGEEKSKIILTQDGSLVDYEVFAVDQSSMTPEEFAARLNEYCLRLCGASGLTPERMYCTGPIFSHPEYMEEVLGKFKSAELLDPFRKVICRAAKGDNDLITFAPQLSVAVGLALRGQPEQ